jgi:hypothetical protein
MLAPKSSTSNTVTVQRMFLSILQAIFGGLESSSRHSSLKQRFTPYVLQFLLGLVASPLLANAATLQTNQPGSKPQKYAVLVGINKYKYSNSRDGFPNLNGCVNDVLRMQKLLLSFGFDPRNIRLLKDAEASHDEVLHALQDLASRAAPGDIVVIHFSGHGSHMDDPAMINGVDETLVAYDSRDPHKADDPTGGDITGEQLSQAIRQIKTKNITVIVDACYSAGLISRSISTALSRGIPPFKRSAHPIVAQQTTESIRTSGSSFALIAAAQQDQEALEYAPNGTRGARFGTLTYFFVNEVRSHLNQSVSYRDIFPEVKKDVKTAHSTQTPSLEGTNEDEAVFSDDSILVPAYVEVSSEPNGTVSLDGGDVQGVTTGSRFDVYRPDTHDFKNLANRLATVEVVSTTAYSSTAKVSSGDKTLPDGSRAIEISHVFPDAKFRVFLEGAATSSTLQSIERGLKNLGNIESARVSNGTQLRVAEVNSAVVLYSADTEKSLSTVALGDGLIDRSLDAIAAWAKWFNVLSIANPSADVHIQLTIDADLPAHDGKALGSQTLVNGQKFKLKFENLSEEGLYVSVIDLREDGGVQRVYQSGVRLLPPGQSFETSSFQAAVPPGSVTYTDILKVFATDKQIDLTFLNQAPGGKGLKGPKPRGAEDALGQLLAQAGFGYSRDIVAVPSDWVTVQKVIEVKQPVQPPMSQ